MHHHPRQICNVAKQFVPSCCNAVTGKGLARALITPLRIRGDGWQGWDIVIACPHPMHMTLVFILGPFDLLNYHPAIAWGFLPLS
jgi:hypothetical protein